MIKRYATGGFLILAAFFFAALTGCCKSDDNGQVFGIPVIYMPQAMQSGGISLLYAVPTGLDTATRNYVVDEAQGTLEVILGVSRSGMQAADGYTVKVSADADTVNAAIGAGKLQAVSLPEKDFSLPTSVDVPAGKNGATFYLSVDLDQLKTFAGKKVAVAVRVSDPSRYTLNKEYSETIVDIDVDALNL
jgi:hypothetical protein